jgi:hypothetical protein
VFSTYHSTYDYGWTLEQVGSISELAPGEESKKTLADPGKN